MSRKKVLAFEESELNKRKSGARIPINLTLLGISFTLFGLVVTLNPSLLGKSLLAYQLVLSIPFFMSSIFARSKLAYSTNSERWDKFGFITFILAYSFLINSVGLLMVNFILPIIVVVFFVTNIVLAIIYSMIQFSYDKRTLKKRIFEDLSFILLIVLFGILPVLGIF